MAADMAVELQKQNVACISLWPGPVMTENVHTVVTDPDVQDEKVEVLFTFYVLTESEVITGNLSFDVLRFPCNGSLRSVISL